MKKAEEFLIRHAQLTAFNSEITALRRGKPIPAQSKLKGLEPFLDDNSLLRVGGRLKNSNLLFDCKHQLILPPTHRVTVLIFEYFHKKYLHIGAQGLLHQVRLKYWPIHGKGLARKIVHACVICFKNKPIAASQVMGNLPTERITPTSPFLNCGVDFCGPFHVQFKGQRKGIFPKIYVAVFICLSTKAIHLEVVTDLTSEAFIAALKRFCARRGKISSIITDNATNFKGAHTELKRLQKLIRKPDEALSSYFTSESIVWKLISPRSPNFGGLWEAGVKSFKYHLRRTMGSTKVTMEEFLTIITQIEGILNSRPLTPMSNDINEFEVLTPGHFLVGRPITSIPEPELIEITDNRLSRWQRTTKFVQLIWKRWQTDYLNHLQQRNKWQFQKSNVETGAMVLLKDENLPPCHWALGRILETIPGTDGKVRVAKVKTASGICTRSISKICLLPM
ncbi:uncharacterized protein LOC118182603 [Stegodyphus dumicola]|uniref:uncharacterized protein LOC118182603 n=1 Tax=Stegodyphus dumicola TaxID=202533 RepID=UPI0015AA1A2C|nr:uncharacterized protein LOC118182603 [Stegodyphus dumicola]